MSLHRSKEDGRLPVMCVADTNYTTLRQYIYMRIHFCNSKRAFPFLFFVRVLFLRPRFHHFVFLLLLSICRVCFCTCLFCFSFCPLFYISCFVAFVFIGVQSTPASIQPSWLSSVSFFACFYAPRAAILIQIHILPNCFCCPNSLCSSCLFCFLTSPRLLVSGFQSKKKRNKKKRKGENEKNWQISSRTNWRKVCRARSRFFRANGIKELGGRGSRIYRTDVYFICTNHTRGRLMYGVRTLFSITIRLPAAFPPFIDIPTFFPGISRPVK